MTFATAIANLGRPAASGRLDRSTSASDSPSTSLNMIVRTSPTRSGSGRITPGTPASRFNMVISCLVRAIALGPEASLQIAVPDPSTPMDTLCPLTSASARIGPSASTTRCT